MVILGLKTILNSLILYAFGKNNAKLRIQAVQLTVDENVFSIGILCMDIKM